MLETELCFKIFSGKGLQVRYTYLDFMSKQLKIAAVITVEYNLPANLIENKFYRRCSTKSTEQCSFV